MMEQAVLDEVIVELCVLSINPGVYIVDTRK